jgi:hypothetical protein
MGCFPTGSDVLLGDDRSHSWNSARDMNSNVLPRTSSAFVIEGSAGQRLEAGCRSSSPAVRDREAVINPARYR